MKLNNQQLIYLDSKEYLLDLEESISRIKSQVHQTDNESMIASAFEKEIYLFLLTKLGVPDNQKHTKISSEEISDGREYSLLFLYDKVEVSC
ncbi:hypothetical protein ACTJ5T_11220 [Streptococcus suis]|uniref:hypothetical protein n=1 Tax=Streptococcus suis TaxID=1307 RepID=UPI003F89F9EB